MTKLGIVFLALICGGCADNATSLASLVGEASSRLRSPEAGATFTASYEPVSGATSPYTVVFFPARAVGEAELVAAGVSKEVSARIAKDLAYLGSTADLLVVDQDGERLTFTTSWRRYAGVRDLVVSQRKNGPAAIEMRRENGTIRVVAVR
jgi:hypothetical protein